MATRKAAKKRGADDPAAAETADVSKDDNSAKIGKPGGVSSTSTPRLKVPAVVGDAHDVPALRAREKSEGRAPPADRGPRGRTRSIIRTPQRNGHGRATPTARSPKLRDRTPVRVPKRSAGKPPRITFEEETEAEAGDRSEGEAEPREVEEEHRIEEHDVSYIDEDTTLMERDFGDARGGYQAPDTDEERRKPVRDIPRDALLLEEWRRVPRNFSLPTFDGKKDNVLSFIDGLVHTFETWSIHPNAQVQFAFAQIRDRTARDWMKKNPTTDFAVFRGKFIERFGSHTLRRDALRALRDIRQIGTSNQEFVAAFEHILEELEHHNLTIGEPELLLFLQLAVNERVRDALEWRSYNSCRAVLNKIANLTSAQDEPIQHWEHVPRDYDSGSTSRASFPPPQSSSWRLSSDVQEGRGTQRRRCHGCGSEEHIIANCPQRNNTAFREPSNERHGHHRRW
jgi:hypothetical protein